MFTLHSEQRQPDFPIDADQMAAKTIQYMDILAEHLVHVRGHHNVAQRLRDEGQVLPESTPIHTLDRAGEERLRLRMEAIIYAPATTVDDHFKVCCAAHTLMLLHHHILRRLPHGQFRVINEKINKLRAERRARVGAQQPAERSRFGPLIPEPLLPILERPAEFKSQDASDTTRELDVFTATRPPIFGKLFWHKVNNNCFRVRSIRFFEDQDPNFSIQFEDSRYDIPVDKNTLRSMLEESVIIFNE